MNQDNKSHTPTLHLLNKISALLILAFLIGWAFGMLSAKLLYEQKLDTMIKIGGFIYNEQIYNITPRDQ
jgi:hypothetical protein